jgi:phosphoribosylglycinamide formyltransferase-1
MKRLGVLISGRGTNLRAVLEAHARGELLITPALVVSNVAGAGALTLAHSHGVAQHTLPHQNYASREAYDQALIQVLSDAQVDIVLLAGFMRVLGPLFCERFRGRIINVHPSLLPAFPGAHAVREALRYGAKVSGATVHFVDEGLDTGPIILQEAVAIAENDDEQTLHTRIQTIEHRLVPQAVQLVATDQLRLDGRRVSLLHKGQP